MTEAIHETDQVQVQQKPDTLRSDPFISKGGTAPRFDANTGERIVPVDPVENRSDYSYAEYMQKRVEFILDKYFPHDHHPDFPPPKPAEKSNQRYDDRRDFPPGFTGA